MPVTDILVHVNETPASSERALLENRLRRIKGVIAPRFNKNIPHLLFIAYDPQQIDSGHLLHHISADGYTAQLVGM